MATRGMPADYSAFLQGVNAFPGFLPGFPGTSRKPMATGAGFSVGSQHDLGLSQAAQTPLSVYNNVTIPDTVRPFQPTTASTWTSLGGAGTGVVPPTFGASTLPYNHLLRSLQTASSYNYVNPGTNQDSFIGANFNIPLAPFFGEFEEGEPIWVYVGISGRGHQDGTSIEKMVNLQTLNYILAHQSTEEYEALLVEAEEDRMELEDEAEEDRMELEDEVRVDRKFYMENWEYMGPFMGATGNSRRGQTIATNVWGNQDDYVNIWSAEDLDSSDVLGFVCSFVARDRITGGRFYLNAGKNTPREVPNMPSKIFQVIPTVLKNGRVPDMASLRSTDSTGEERDATWLGIGVVRDYDTVSNNRMENVFFDARKKLLADPIKVQGTVNVKKITS